MVARVSWLGLAVAVAASCQPTEDDWRWESSASCDIIDHRGHRCHQYRLTDPYARNGLRTGCTGAGLSFDEDDDCPDDDRVGICELPMAPLTGTHVYAGYVDLAGFIASCREAGGTWEPE